MVIRKKFLGLGELITPPTHINLFPVAYDFFFMTLCFWWPVFAGSFAVKLIDIISKHNDIYQLLIFISFFPNLKSN
jgi:hypothetical protein